MLQKQNLKKDLHSKIQPKQAHFISLEALIRASHR